MKTIERHRYKDKEIFQTRTLTYNPYPMIEIESVIGSITSNLTPELVTKKYREENATNPMFGHCYHSSQALFYLMDTDVLEQRTAIDYHEKVRSVVESHDFIIENEDCFALSVKKANKYAMGDTNQVDYAMKIRNLKDEAKDEDEESGIDD